MHRPPANRYFSYALILTLVGSLFSAVLPVFQTSYASHTNIAVEVDNDVDEPYEENDDVVIEGTIDDLEQDLDSVDITIRDSENDEVDSDTVELGSSDNFDMVFNVGGGDPDGVYEVEVEYDTESAFTYFIVDNDNDLVTVVLGDTIYAAGDDVEIAGAVDDVVDGETEVEITVIDPNNVEIVDQDNAELGDGSLDEDEFEYTFDLDNDADHGRYAVIVSYDGDDQQGFVLFEIEDDDSGGSSTGGDGDSGTDGDITAEIGEATYEPGDTVSVTGNIDNYDSSNELEIIVEDPDGVDIESDDDVSVQSDGDFTFEFDLDDNADEGQYDVTLTYDTDELGLTFDVEEGGGSSTGGDGDSGTDGDITAEIGEATYEPGDTVSVTGNIDNYDSSNELEIIVEDPDGVDIESDDDVSVQSDGDFTFEFDLDDNADEGQYDVTLTYDTDELGLTFDVEEGGGSTGGGSSSSITVRLNKSSYLAGELVTVTGTVPQVVEDEVVSILLYRPDGIVVLEASQYVEPASDETYSGTIRLDSDLEVDDNYSIKVGYDGRETEVEFDITGQAAGTAAITVDTDRDTYQSGATVRITGSVAEDLLDPTEDQLLLRFNAPDNNPCRIDPVDLGNDGSFSYSLVLGGKCGLTGEYEVIATYNQEDGETTFVLEGALGEGGRTYNLNVEGRSYQIEYELNSASIDSMFARTGEKKLVIDIDADDEGRLTLVLPRQVIDAIRNGQDIAYVVTIEDESGEITNIDFEESENNNQSRTLVIDYPAGGGRIEIAGTQIVPEFGLFAVIMMAGLIVGIIMATARGGNSKFSVFRR